MESDPTAMLDTEIPIENSADASRVLTPATPPSTHSASRSPAAFSRRSLVVDTGVTSTTSSVPASSSPATSLAPREIPKTRNRMGSTSV